MTTTDQALPREALFEPDGHLTEIALACVADGQLDLVPAAALGHLDGCDRCTRLLGEAALLSVAAGDALASLAAVTMGGPERAPQTPPGQPVLAARARRPLPVAAIAAALLVALLTAGTSFVEAVHAVSAAVTAAPFMVRVAAAFVRAPWGQGSTALLVKCASALVLAAIGLQVARATSRARSLQNGGV